MEYLMSENILDITSENFDDKVINWPNFNDRPFTLDQFDRITFRLILFHPIFIVSRNIKELSFFSKRYI